MSRDDVITSLIGGLFIAGVVALVIGFGVARYRECRTHFSVFYCLSGR